MLLRAVRSLRGESPATEEDRRAEEGAAPDGPVDPNPDPPPLVEEIAEFKRHCCMRLTLLNENCRRSLAGPPECTVDVVRGARTGFGVTSHAYVESRGYRPYMEDRIIAEPLRSGSAGLYAVLDGHGLEGEGHIVSDYASRHLTAVVDKHLAAGPEGSSMRDKFDHAFSELDNRLRRLLPVASENNGTTLTAVLVEPRLLTFANLGDSRAVLVGADYRVEFVTLDHKPSVASEEQRVIAAGGFIDDMRVNGDLAVSRTLGDVTYKPQGAPRRLCPISNEPDVSCIRREPHHRCALLASDGLWDAMSTAEVVAALRKHGIFEAEEAACREDQSADGKAAIAFRTKVQACLEGVLKEATGARLSSDNLTLLIVMLGAIDAEPARTASARAIPVRFKQKSDDDDDDHSNSNSNNTVVDASAADPAGAAEDASSSSSSSSNNNNKPTGVEALELEIT